MDCSPLGSSVHGILQAKILKWVAFPFSSDLPHPGIEPRSPALQADSLPSEPQGSSLTGDQAQASVLGAVQSWPLDHQGRPQ